VQKPAGEDSMTDEESTCVDSVYEQCNQSGYGDNGCIPKSVKELLGKNRTRGKASDARFVVLRGGHKELLGTL
jgi:hypothetical protein